MKTQPLKLDPLTMIMFPLSLVLFELSVYIGNDLVQPAMLTIVKYFGVDASWVSASMSLYILGGAALTCFVGPLSDRYGRRKTMLIGALYFVISNLLILLSFNIESFMFMRLIQGSALCFISAVGYVCIQEAFEEHKAIKTMALMANIAMIAPLLGPLIGAALISVAPWHAGFVLVSFIALVSFVGLFKFMPETVDTTTAPRVNVKNIWTNYKAALTSRKFMQLCLFTPIISIPMLVWIALSPVFLIRDLGLSNFGYGLSQLPIFGCLIAGNLILAKFTNRMEIGRSVYLSIPINLLGAFFLLLAGLTQGYELPFIVIGISLLSFAFGLSFSVLYRLTLMSVNLPKGVLAAVMSFIMMASQGLAIELLNFFYIDFGLNKLAIVMTVCMIVYTLITRPVMKLAMKRDPNVPVDDNAITIAPH